MNASSPFKSSSERKERSNSNSNNNSHNNSNNNSENTTPEHTTRVHKKGNYGRTVTVGRMTSRSGDRTDRGDKGDKSDKGPDKRTSERTRRNSQSSKKIAYSLSGAFKLPKSSDKEDREEDDMEKFRKQFPDAQVPREVFECTYKRNYNSSSGKLYVTINALYFLGKLITKEWDASNLVEVDKEEKVKDEDSETIIKIALKILKYRKADNRLVVDSLYFKNPDIGDQCWKCICRQFFDPLGERNSALHSAVLNSHHSWRIRLIIDKDPNKLQVYNRYNQTPLFLACIQGNTEIVELLLDNYKKYNININNTEVTTGNHLLHVLCQERVKDDILKLIIDYPRIEVNASNVDGTTPLHYFCKCTESVNCNELIDQLIQVGAYVNVENCKKETPIHRAMQNRGGVGPIVVKALLKHHPNLNTGTAESKETPLHYAVRLGRAELISMMIDAGSDITVRNSEGHDALMIAIKEYESLDAEYDRKMIENYEQIIKILKNVKRMREILVECGLQDLLENFMKKEIYTDLRNFLRLEDDVLKKKYSVGLGPLFKLQKYKYKLKQEIEAEEKIACVLGTSKVPLKNEIKDLRKDLFRSSETGTWEIDSRCIELSENLGRGTSGVVFKALWKKQEVAIKILTTDSDELIDEFKKELLILVRINSPFVVKFYGATIFPYLSLVMEYCDNGSLHDYLKKSSDLSWDLVLSFTSNMAAGLKDLHNYNPPIIHRDLKSLNILVTRDLTCKVCDFGLSRLFTVENNTFNKICGTPAYVAPEIFLSNGKAKATSKSDVYSMGIILWELVNTATVKKYITPFAEYGLAGQVIIVEAALSKKRPSLPQNTPGAIAQLYLNAVHESPDARPSASEISDIISKATISYQTEPESFYTPLQPPPLVTLNNSTTDELSRENSLNSLEKDTQFKGWDNFPKNPNDSLESHVLSIRANHKAWDHFHKNHSHLHDSLESHVLSIRSNPDLELSAKEGRRILISSTPPPSEKEDSERSRTKKTYRRKALDAGIKAYDSHAIDPTEQLGSKFTGWSSPAKD